MHGFPLAEQVGVERGGAAHQQRQARTSGPRPAKVFPGRTAKTAQPPEDQLTELIVEGDEGEIAERCPGDRADGDPGEDQRRPGGHARPGGERVDGEDRDHAAEKSAERKA